MKTMKPYIKPYTELTTFHFESVILCASGSGPSSVIKNGTITNENKAW